MINTAHKTQNYCYQYPKIYFFLHDDDDDHITWHPLGFSSLKISNVLNAEEGFSEL